MKEYSNRAFDNRFCDRGAFGRKPWTARRHPVNDRVGCQARATTMRTFAECQVMSDENTRDIAVEAKTLIEAHMTDCSKFRDSLLDIHKEFRDDLKKINWRMSMFIGGLIVLSHGFDYAMKILGH